MDLFLELFDKLDQTKSNREKVEFIKEYFDKATPDDAAWALFFLSGHRLKRIIGPSKLFDWCLEALPLPPWLILECLSSVGDLGETIALLFSGNKTTKSNLTLNSWITERIIPLKDLPADLQKEKIFEYWEELDKRGIFILNKILTGSLRVGVSSLITVQALSKAINVSKENLLQMLMGDWNPSAEFFENLKKGISPTTSLNPYPFYLATPINNIEELTQPNEWLIEWKWDGIRAQCIKRNDKAAIWSRGNELISHQFPEILDSLKKLQNGTVLDGELLAWQDDSVLPFGELQKRLGRKNISKAMIEKLPVIYMLYDVLEYEGKDIRKVSLSERKEILKKIVNLDSKFKMSPVQSFDNWENVKLMRLKALQNNTEGLMIKKKDSHYGVGRRKGNWWKYKVDPKTIDAVLIYAQPGQGWRANLYTDYTFGVWASGELVPIAKAYSGLSTEEIKEMDRWIRKNTLEKFGPVRKVKPEQVFELAFEGIQISSRHKSGIAFRFPRILRWRKDKPASECDTLESIKNEFKIG